jgi:triacylglycerol lipase
MMHFILEIFKMLLAVAIAVSCFTYSFFWYESANTSDRSPGISGKCLPLLIFRGILSSIASLFVVVALFPLGFVRSLWRPRTISPGQPLIILAHGLYHNASAWFLFKRRLEAAGFHNIYAPSYTSFFTSFDATLEKFERLVRSVREDAGGVPVILIGHSLGGLLSRVYAEKAESMDIPEFIITLGTPHLGSKMAAFGVGALAQSLLFRGPLFTKIENGSPHLPCPGISFFSPVDNLVLPAEALKAPYAGWLYYETGPVSHVAMLFSKQIVRNVIEVIQEQCGVKSI